MLFNSILKGISGIFTSVGINLEFLERTLTYIENGDLSNGRLKIYLIAFQGFLKSPLWGKKIR